MKLDIATLLKTAWPHDKWVREHRFDPKRRWRFDYACPTLLVAVEIEGGTYSRGRHIRGKGYARDCEKYNAATLDGWLLLRYTTQQVEREGARVVDEVSRLCRGAVLLMEE